MAEAIFPDRPSRGKAMSKPDEATLRDLYEVQYIFTTEIARRFHVRRSTVLEWFKEYGIAVRRARRKPAEALWGVDEAKLRDLYETRGMTMVQIADSLGIPRTTVEALLKRFGIAMRPQNYEGKGAMPRPDEASLRDLYEAQGLSAGAIGERYGVSFTTVLKWLRSYGIEIRPGGVPKGYNCQAPDEATLRDLSETRRLTTREIGDRLGVSHMSIKRWLRMYGIKARPKSAGLANRGIEAPTRDDLYRMLHVEHIGFRGVAERYGVDYTAIAYWAKKHGIEPPTVWQTRTKGQQPTLNPEEVRSLYEAGYSMDQIGAMFGVSSEPVRLIFEKHGIEPRPSGLTGQRYFCSNGLEVRSAYEIRVAEWLIAHGVEFVNEPHYPFGGKLRADFLANGWYIEVWGVYDLPGYDDKKRRKIRLCEAHDIPLIQLNRNHFSAKQRHILEQRLSKVLSPAPAPTVQGTLF